MALFLRIAAVAVALTAIANAIAFIGSLFPRPAGYGPLLLSDKHDRNVWGPPR